MSRIRRHAVAYAAALLGVAAITAAGAPFVGRLNDTTVALAYLLVVLFVAARRGRGPAFAASLLAVLTFNFCFLPPLYELTIADPRNWVALAAFLITAVVAGQLSEQARRRALEAEAGRERARQAAAYDRSLIEASLDAMVAIGRDGTITDVNAAAERLTGCARPELIGTEFSRCFTEPQRASADQHQAFREGIVRNSTLAIRHRDGRAVPVLSNASVYRDDRGEVVGVFVVARELGAPMPVAAGAAIHEPAPQPVRRVARAAADRRSEPVAERDVRAEAAAGRMLLALVPPLVTVVIQYALWPVLQPFAWFLFYPAVFVSSRIGGLRGGMLATAFATVLAWWFFIPPEHVFVKGEPRYLIAAAAFAITGGLFSVLQNRLEDATRAATRALAESHVRAEGLRHTSDEIARLVEQASDAIFVADHDGGIVDVNRRGAQMTGQSREALVGRPLAELFAPQDAERLRCAAEGLQRGGIQIAEFALRRHDADDLPVEVSAKILPDGRWQAFARDITERKHAEAELLRAHRAQRALSSCNQALVRAGDEAELLAEICRITVEEAGYRFCWVGRAEHGAEHAVRPIAQAGFETGYLERARITWADDERGRGPTGTAIREQRVVVARDIATDPRLAPWRAEALRRGYASSIAIPVMFDASTPGAMTIYAADPGAFGEREVALLSELAGDLAYGIATLRTRAERDKAQDELRALNAELEQRVASRTGELRAAREREAETGGRIQQMLLLDEPPRDLRGLRVAALTVPSQQIAGDFYGFFHHEATDCLDVIIADVMGKGVPAALLGAATKSQFPRALWHLMAESPVGTLPEPRDIVTLAHTSMARSLIGLESFVTACYARFDVASRTVTLVDCGHTGVVHLRRDRGDCTIVHGDNLPLGVRDGEIYDQLAVHCEVGDVVVLFSDGVTEARDARGELFGPDRLVECVRQHAGAEPAALVAAVREAAGRFAGSAALADDLTCVVVQVTPHRAPLARTELEIHSELGELRRARELVAGFCQTRLSPPLDDAAVSALVLAVDEAACNVIKHAYHGRADQRIQLVIEAHADRVAVRLRYLGAPFDPSAVPPPSFDGSRESGFGVFLIAQSVDAVRYDRDDLDRSCIYLEKLRPA